MGNLSRRLVIVGAGSSGLGVALAAARRGWKVLLVDAQDIGGGTSTTSTKLIHGGVRYLESAIRRLRLADWQLVREALRERKWMIESHPQLCHPLPIVVPVSKWWERLYYGSGLKFYDYLGYPYRLHPTRWIEKTTLYEYFPNLQRMFIGGWLYWDGQFEDRLYAVHLALYLHQRFGTEIRTRSRVTTVKVQGERVYLGIEDASGSLKEVEGDFLVNATGPWADFLRKQLRPHVKPRLRVSRGSHLVLQGLPPLRMGFLIPRTEDGRLIFVLPWKEGTWLVGTTDEEASAPEWKPSVPAGEEIYLRNYFSRYFTGEGEVVAKFAGYRPLVAADSEASTARLARNHVIEVWKRERTIHLMGGKWTTFRSMGEDVIKALYRVFLQKEPPAGEPIHRVVPDLRELETLRATYPLPIVEGEPFTEGEVRFWRRFAWAQTPEDIVEGRWQLHLINAKRAEKLRRALAARWDELV